MRQQLEQAVDVMQENGADYADIRFETFESTSVEVQDARVEDLSKGISRGIGFRAFCNGVWGFTSTNDVEKIEETAAKAVKTAKALRKRSKAPEFSLEPGEIRDESLDQRAVMPPGTLNIDEKLALVEDAETEMRFTDEHIKTTRARYSDYEGRTLFVNSEGSFIERQPTHFTLYCYATARKGDNVETYVERAASNKGMQALSKVDPMSMGVTAAEMAAKIVQAPKPPSGSMPVVLGKKLGGLFAHEAVGHAAEADTVLSGDSIFEGKQGETVGSEHVTVVDDPTIKGKHGSYRFDDEGIEGRRTPVIKNGELRSFIHSRETASRMDTAFTGNGRAQSYGHVPAVRMSNTFFETGDATEDEILSSMDDGLILNGFKGGQVSTAEGNFIFGTTHGYVVEDGERKELVKGPSISGRTLQVLANVSMVADSLKIGDPGYCGKNGQTVFVDTGSPMMKIDEMVVG